MSWTALADGVAAVLLLGGCLLTLIAAFGMVALPDLLSRLHAVTKPQVLGLMLVLGGLALRLRSESAIGLLLLVVLFQLATSPIASHMVARAAFRSGQVDEDRLVVDELSDALEDEEPRGAP